MISQQLEIFPRPELHGFASQEELDENLSIWYEVMMQNEREDEEELQIWFDIMMQQDREEDERFREEMYWQMMNEEAEAESERQRLNEEDTWKQIEEENEKQEATLLRGINGSGVAKRRRTGSRFKRQQQELSRKLHACNRQETI